MSTLAFVGPLFLFIYHPPVHQAHLFPPLSLASPFWGLAPSRVYHREYMRMLLLYDIGENDREKTGQKRDLLFVYIMF